MNPLRALDRLRASSAERWLRLLMGASVVLPLVILAVVAWHDYDESVARAKERVDRTTRIAREHALKVFETNEIIIRRVRDLIGSESDRQLAVVEEELHAKLRDIADGVPQVAGIWLWDAAGHALASDRQYPVPAGLSIANRDYFRAGRADGDRLVFSDTMRDPTTGQSIFAMSRRREDAAGHFAGALTIAMFSNYFSDFYKQVAANDRGLSIALIRPDGAVITRFPDAPAPGQRIVSDNPLIPLIDGPAATTPTLVVSPEDGQRRYVAAQRVGDFPLFVSTGLLQSAVIGGWARRLFLPASVALVAGLALFLLSAMTLRKTRQEQAAVAQMQEEAARRAAAERELSHLSQHLIRLSETEKAKLARELHDELGGALSAITLDIAWVLERLRTVAPALVDRQSQALRLVQETAVLKRRIIDGLHPMLLQHLGLVVALRDHVTQWSRKSGVPVHLALPDDAPALDHEAALALFRVVQESLTNVARYADARSVAVELTEGPRGVTLLVTDDGKGIPAETLAHPTSHGITGMKQRMAHFGGTLTVASAGPGQGTQVTAHLPRAPGATTAAAASELSTHA